MMENLKVIRQTGKTRIRKMPYKRSHLFTNEIWFNEKWVDIGHSRTLKAAEDVCRKYEV